MNGPGILACLASWRDRMARIPTAMVAKVPRTRREWVAWARRWWWAAPGVTLAAAVVVLARGTGVVEVPWSWIDVRTGVETGPGDRGDPSELEPLARALRDMAPRGPYIVVDQTNNRLYLKVGDRVLREAVCSAGSGMVLRDSEKGRVWVFDTPRGVFRVQKKARNPVWKKPDWAFIEEGKRPPARASERIEYGTLGEYALYLGDGYMIHGTLYERLLGRSVTHGCIRLGKEDLRAVHDAVEVGTEVYIF